MAQPFAGPSSNYNYVFNAVQDVHPRLFSYSASPNSNVTIMPMQFGQSGITDPPLPIIE